MGGFVYHVLGIPGEGHGPSGSCTGETHVSPAFHVRRAHLRQLASDRLTFVKQCFVGDRARGFVGKHYQVGAGDGYAGR